MKPLAKKPQRCAIYTRVSTDNGLEQEFNSLHAQREAAQAYIKSQAHEGWKLIRDHYDDGGFSGGSLDRPALQKLLADIRERRIDIVVVYKVDRLTRSLTDFAKLVELSFPPPALPGFSGTTSLSVTPKRPACPSRASDWSSLTTPWGFPCCARFPCVRAAASTPVQRLGVVFAHLTQPYQPSPKLQSGRPAHRPFRGLLGVHSRCGPHTRAVTYM